MKTNRLIAIVLVSVLLGFCLLLSGCDMDVYCTSEHYDTLMIDYLMHSFVNYTTINPSGDLFELSKKFDRYHLDFLNASDPETAECFLVELLDGINSEISNYLNKADCDSKTWSMAQSLRTHALQTKIENLDDEQEKNAAAADYHLIKARLLLAALEDFCEEDELRWGLRKEMEDHYKELYIETRPLSIINLNDWIEKHKSNYSKFYEQLDEQERQAIDLTASTFLFQPSTWHLLDPPQHSLAELVVEKNWQ